MRTCDAYDAAGRPATPTPPDRPPSQISLPRPHPRGGPRGPRGGPPHLARADGRLDGAGILVGYTRGLREQGLPTLYRRTYFGRPYLDLIGPALEAAPWARLERLGPGLVRADVSNDPPGADDYDLFAEARDAVMDSLGRDLFWPGASRACRPGFLDFRVGAPPRAVDGADAARVLNTHGCAGHWGEPRPSEPPHGAPYHRPMLLAIDVGNTNITLGLVEGGAIAATRRAGTPRGMTADELELLLTGLLALDGRSLEDVGAMTVASVVPAATASLESVARRRGIAMLIASSGTVPVAVRVDRPGEVGADRIVNALAASRLYGTPAVIVDFGTATTFDCVGPDGAYLGGAIAPGLELGLDALASRTAKLPRVEMRAPDHAIGRDTVSAMQAGTIFGYQALATGLLARLRAELADTTGSPQSDIRTILTGGLSAAPWAHGIEGVDVIDPDLTLKGLAILHAEVAGGEPLADGR